jgi:hypothetical protein
MMPELVRKMRTQLDQWHEDGLVFFPMDPAGWGPDDTLEGQAYRLVYHSYENWHTEEIVQTISDDVIAMKNYRQGILHNRGRNEAMEALDRMFCGLQKGTGEWHSETLASILDRMTVLHLKKLHALVEAPQRVPLLQEQADFLADYAGHLYDDMLAGRRRCIWFVRLKLFNK